jgi:hypothetical protein
LNRMKRVTQMVAIVGFMQALPQSTGGCSQSRIAR